MSIKSQGASIDVVPGIELGVLEEALRFVATEAGQLLEDVVGVHPGGTAQRYWDWIDRARTTLEGFLFPAQVEELLFTQEYWVIRQDPHRAHHQHLLPEVERRQQNLLELADEVHRFRRRWSIPTGMVLVPDTNVFLHGEKFFTDMDWVAQANWSGKVYIVVPRVVVHELDKQKRNHNKDVRTRARNTIRELLAHLPTDPWDRSPLKQHGQPSNDVFIEALVPPLDHAPLPVADDEIVAQALQVKAYSGERVVIVTGDAAMQLTARSVDLEVRQLMEPAKGI